MKKIAVIGAGIFGLTSAIELSQKGYRVTVFEKNTDILMGATNNSVLRLHLGFHYPRDLETAIQSRKGYEQFIERFPEVIDFNFKNYYAVAKNNSQVTNQEFKAFTQKAQLSMIESSFDELASLGFAVNECAGIYLNKEGVISIDKLRKRLYQEILNTSITLKLNNGIAQIAKLKNKWLLTDCKKDTQEFDFIIRSTYGSDRIEISEGGGGEGEVNSKRLYEFHKTLVLRVNLNLPYFGVTIIDGDFLTVLPSAFNDEHLLYGPSPSVLKKYVGMNYPASWDLIKNNDSVVREATSKILNRYKLFFPKCNNVTLVGINLAIRAIDANVHATDRRISALEYRAHNFIDICSGKIDHCVGMAKNVLSEVNSRFLE